MINGASSSAGVQYAQVLQQIHAQNDPVRNAGAAPIKPGSVAARVESMNAQNAPVPATVEPPKIDVYA